MTPGPQRCRLCGRVGRYRVTPDLCWVCRKALARTHDPVRAKREQESLLRRRGGRRCIWIAFVRGQFAGAFNREDRALARSNVVRCVQVNAWVDL